MANPQNHFKNFVELKKLVADAIFSGKISAGGGPRASYPIPVFRQGRVQVAYMIYYYAFRPGLVQIWPPSRVVWFDPISGALTAEISVTPNYFNRKDSKDRPLRGNDIMGISTETFDNFLKRLPSLYDILFEAWATQSQTLKNSDLKNQAREFINIFFKVSENPLHPYYEILGHDYFEWLRKLAQ